MARHRQVRAHSLIRLVLKSCVELESIFDRVGLPVCALETHKEEQAYEIYPTRFVTPSDDSTHITYALSPLTAGATMTLLTGDSSKPWIVQHTNDVVLNLLKSKLYSQSIDWREKLYDLRPVQFGFL